MYITSRFKNSSENKDEIEKLCLAVRDAGIKDFHFIRDVENYQTNFFKNQKELWAAALEHLKDCDALLIDISDSPSGGRLVEAGIAYALSKPIIVIVKNGVEYKDFYDGIADLVIKYSDVQDISVPLSKFFSKI